MFFDLLLQQSKGADLLPLVSPMTTIESNDAFFAVLRSLIERWCDRRCLKALHYVLGPYLAFAGLTDSWGDLHVALQNVRALAKIELTADELELVDDLIRAAGRALARR
jgi:hypothetical protein